jgi:hypothetical protein
VDEARRSLQAIREADRERLPARGSGTLQSNVVTPAFIVQAVLGVGLAAANMVFWWFVVRRWHDRFRRRCERRYGVTIGWTARGHWRVSGDVSRLRRFAIEWLQLVYFMAAFAVWGVAMLLGIGVLSLLGPT